MKKMVLGKLPPGKFPPEKFLRIKLPPRKSPHPQEISHLECSHSFHLFSFFS